MTRSPWFRSLLIAASCACLALAWVAPPVELSRGPYLQGLGASGTTIVFRTSASSAATVRLGRWPGPPWEIEVDSPAGVTHVVEVRDLLADTRYHYEVEAGGRALTPAGECSFRTAPAPNARRPFRFLAWGDSGTGNSSQMEVAARMEEVYPLADLALGLGDLVYPNGEAENYDPRFFTPYRKLFRTTAIWPTIGNHDAGTLGGAPYLEAFYLPTGSGAPGHPSNTELYYSFDHGMAHFVCVDSQVSSNAPGSAMYGWIEDDLAHARAQGKRWLLVFMHHPPYSKGTHDSDVESELIELHDNLVPLFEAHGVDLVLTGHSHVYERSYLVHDDAILQADPDTYTKYGSPDGTVYLVNGCGGASGSGSLDHPLMAVSKGNVEGANVFDVSYESIHGYFLESDGTTTDIFTLRKEPDAVPPRLLGVRAPSDTRIDLVYDAPVTGGTGTYGAEALANYAITPAVNLLDANLFSDRRTVALSVSPMATNSAWLLEVLRVEDSSGNRGACTGVFVAEGASGALVPPRALIAADRHAGNLPARVELDAARSSDADGTITAYTWDFGDGSALAHGPLTSHVYSTAGLFVVALVVRDDDGLESLATQEIRVHDVGVDPAPALEASAAAIQAGGFVDFDAGASLDPDGGPLYVVWDFGDPGSGEENRSTRTAVRHVFASSGTYTVTLTTMDDEGSVVTSSSTIVVEGDGDGAGGFSCSAATGGSPLDGDLPLFLGLAVAVLLARRLHRAGARPALS
jgi:PKD repeat protein